MKHTVDTTYIQCEKCFYKAKSSKDLTVHTFKHHTLVRMEEGSSVTKFRWNGQRQCNICGYESQADQINAHIETEHYGVIEDRVISLHQEKGFVWM